MENDILVNIKFAAQIDPRLNPALNNLKRQINDLSRTNVNLAAATGQALPGMAQQVGALNLLAKQGDATAKAFLAARQQTGLYYKIFSGNVKENLAQVFRGHENFRHTMSALRSELKNVIVATDQYGNGLSVLNDKWAMGRIMATVFAERVNRLADTFIRLGKQWQWVGRQLIVGVTAPFAAMTYIFGRQALELNKQQTTLQKFLMQTGLTAAEAAQQIDEKINPALEHMAVATGTSIDEITSLAAEWVAAGYDLNTGLIQVTNLTAKLQLLSQGEIDVSQAMELVRSVQASFNLSIEETAQTVAQLSLIAGITSLQLEDMAESFPKTAAAAAGLGLNVVETAAALAGMRQRGVQASEAANALKTILSRIAAPTNEAAEDFAEATSTLGEAFDQFRDKDLGGLSLDRLAFTPAGAARGVETITDLAEIYSLLNDRQQNLVADSVAGQRQVDRFRKLRESAVDPTSDFAKAIEEASDQVAALSKLEEQVAAVTASTAKQWDIFRVKIELAAAKIGEKMLPVLEDMVDSFMNVMNTVGDLDSDTVAAFTRIGAAIAALGPIIFTVAQSMLVFGNIMKGPSMLAGKLFLGAKSFEAPEAITQMGLAKKSALASVLAGMPIMGGGLGTIGAQGGAQAILAAAVKGGSVPDDVIKAALTELGMDAEAQLRDKKGRFAGGKIWKYFLAVDEPSITTVSKEAAESLNTNMTRMANNQSLWSKTKNAFTKLFGTWTQTAIIPASAAMGGMNAATVITTKFTSKLGLLATLLPIVVGALINWKDVWAGMSEPIGRAGEVLKDAFSTFAEGVVGVFKSNDAVREGASVWENFGSILGTFIEGMARVAAGIVDAIRPAVTIIVSLTKAFGESLVQIVTLFTNPIKAIKDFFGTLTSNINPAISILGKLVAVLAAIGLGIKVFAIAKTMTIVLSQALHALGVAIFSAQRSWSAFVIAIRNIELKSVILAIGQLILTLVTAFGLFGDKVSEELKRAQESAEQFNDSMKDLIITIQEGTTSAGESVNNFVSLIVQGFRDSFRGSIEQAMNEALNGMGDGLKLFDEWIEKAAGAQDSFLKNNPFSIDFSQFKGVIDDAADIMYQRMIPGLAKIKSLNLSGQMQFREGMKDRISATQEVLRQLKIEYRMSGNAETRKRLLKEILSLEAEIAAMMRGQEYISGSINDEIRGASFGETLRDKLSELQGPSSDAGKEAGKAFNEAYRNELENQLSQLTSRVTESIMEEFDRIADARIDAIDKQIDAIREQDEEEERLQRNRELRAQRQEILERMALNSAIAARERLKALHEGRFDDARLIALRALAEEQDNESELSEIDQERREERVSQERDKQIEILESQKEKLQEQFDRQRELLENMLEEITEFGAKNVGEWKSMYGEIADLARQNGVEVNRIESNFMDRFGMTITEGIADAMKDARSVAEVEAEKAGKATADAFGDGVKSGSAIKIITKILTLLDRIEMLNIKGGSQQAITAAYGEIEDLLGRLSNKGVEFHTGGRVQGRAKSDIPATLQEGEYVINRNAVKAFGVDYFNAINFGKKYHEGGLAAATQLAAGLGTASFGLMPRIMQQIGVGIGNRIKESIVKFAKGQIQALAGGGEGGMITGKGIFQVAPVDAPVAFYSDFGAARSGGRTHQGNDIFVVKPGGGIIPTGVANTGRIARAPFSGSLSVSSGGELAGNSYVVSGSEGYAFGAHLYRHLRGAGSVKAGEPIGIVGNTGNAIGTPPHLHFEWHPGGGSAIDPYTMLSNIYGSANWGRGQNYGVTKRPARDDSEIGMIKDDSVADVPAGGNWGKSDKAVERSIKAGKILNANKGWSDRWNALYQLWASESGWRWWADNPTSSAYGIPQSLPGSKMAAAGADWETNPITQIKWGLGYIADRYGNPENAWAFKQANNWYHDGGLVPLKTGGVVRFNTPAMLHPGETVIPANVTKALSAAAGGGSGDVVINVNINGNMFADETGYRKLHRTLETVGRKIARERGQGPRSFGGR